MNQNYEAVIGLECHAQLLTNSKLFCSCSTKFGNAPNMNTCPVCLGLPGALPVLNRTAVTLAVRAGLALNCRINPESQWSRKNYFYPDLPKGYQISQYDRPLAQHGFVEIYVDGTRKKIRVQRIHMEEDAGKSLHEGFPDSGRFTYLDFNRSGVPLVEIVTDPDLRSSAEAYDYLSRLKEILEYLDVCDGNMEEGSLRCDANVSVRRTGEELGTRTEVKNVNSFRFLRAAIEFEIARQIDVLESGGTIDQETRLFDPNNGETRVMRSKEEAHDYRYFPEPDLRPLDVDEAWIEEVRRSLPELPAQRVERYQREHGLSSVDAEILVASRDIADYFDATVAASGNARAAANWIRNDVLRVQNEGIAYKLAPEGLAKLIRLIDS